MADIVQDYTKMCPSYVWMPPVHTQHKESMLCQTKGCPYALYIWMPHMFGCPLYLWMPPMFGWPPVSLDAPICLPVCLDTPCVWMPMYVWVPPMFGCPLYAWTPHMLDTPYLWIMFGCPLYIHSTKKACFVRLRECPYAPYIWMPPYVWISHCMFRCHHMSGCLLYVWMLPNVWGDPKVWGTSKHMRGVQKYRGCIQTYGGI